MTSEWPRVYAERNYFSLWEIMSYWGSTWQTKVLVRKWIVTDIILTGWCKAFTMHCMNSVPHLQLITKCSKKHRLQVHSLVTYMAHAVSQYTFALPSWLVNYHCKGEPIHLHTMFCSAMKHSIKRSGWAFLKISEKVEFLVSPSKATTRGLASPIFFRATP